MAVDELLQVQPANELHRHEILAANLPQVIGLDDVGMDEIGDEARLTDEVLLELRDARIFFSNQLDGDHLAEVACSFLNCFEDQPHPALREFVGQLILELVENMLQSRRGHEPTKAAGFPRGKNSSAKFAHFLL